MAHRHHQRLEATQSATGESVSPGPHPEEAERPGADGEEATDKAGVGPLQDARYSGGAGAGAGQGGSRVQAVYETGIACC